MRLREQVDLADLEGTEKGAECFRILLERILQEKELSIAEAAELVGVSTPTVERWLSGNSMPMPKLRRMVLTCLLEKKRC